MRSLLAKLGPVIAAAALLASLAVPDTHAAQLKQSPSFPVAAHDGAGIEWWYLYAHVTTKSQRHLAVVISFFRFADLTGQTKAGASAAKFDSQQDHYLLCGVTDEDTSTHQTYSLADKNTLAALQMMTTLALLADPNNARALAMSKLVAAGQLPPPSKVIPGICSVQSSPHFNASYGTIASLKAVTGKPNTYILTFNGEGFGSTGFTLRFIAEKQPMVVGGTGNTGVVHPDDMKYISLTRCAVSGEVAAQSGDVSSEEQASGEGWFDHQWGSSWLPTAVGCDWFGIQLSDGRDILVFRQRTLTTGAIFGPLATIEDKNGKLTVTRNIVFTPDVSAIWNSAKTGVDYPLGWTIKLPDQHLELDVKAAIQDQELPALGNTRGAIWEGTVDVNAYDFPQKSVGVTDQLIVPTRGTGYMELVGYGAPAVAKLLSEVSN
jgi:predicted secreted hydrolase